MRYDRDLDSIEQAGKCAFWIAVALAVCLLLCSLFAPAPPPARGEEPCLRASVDYQRIYPPQGTILNRRPASWATCTPWENQP